jgi:glycosyltransferase involved in cell wall biosynthesis
MKVLHLIDSLEVGGTEESLVASLQPLRELGCENVVAYLSGPGTSVARARADAEVISLGVGGGCIGPARLLANELRRLRPDILHTNLFKADQIGRVVGRALSVPVVSSWVNTSYEPARLLDNPRLTPLKLAAVRRIDSASAHLVSHFIANSETVAESNARCLRVPLSRVSVVHRGRDVRRYSIDRRAARMRVGEELALAEDTFIMLNVGRLIDQKGQRYLVRAAGGVLADYQHAVLLIAGEGRLRPNLEREIDILGLGRRVFLLGTRNDIPELLAASDLFVLPSLFEGAAGAAIEAMFSGKAVIASDIPTLRECLGEAHPEVFVQPQDVEAWARAMEWAMKQPQQLAEMGLANRELALRKYSLEESARKQFEVYVRVVGGGTSK